MKFENFERFVARKYHEGELTAKEYSQLNILIGEFNCLPYNRKMREPEEVRK